MRERRNTNAPPDERNRRGDAKAELCLPHAPPHVRDPLTYLELTSVDRDTWGAPPSPGPSTLPLNGRVVSRGGADRSLPRPLGCGVGTRIQTCCPGIN